MATPFSKLIVLLAVLILPALAQAESPPESPETESSFWDDLRWDMSIGVGIDFSHDILAVAEERNLTPFFDVNFSLEYKNFYFDVQRSNLPGGAFLGYQLWQGEDWQLDLVGGTYISGFDENGNLYTKTSGPWLAGITRRDDDFNVGLKIARQFQYVDFSSELVNDVGSAHGAWMWRSVVSKAIPLGNWDMRGGVGIDLYSARLANYYYGVSAGEANAYRPQYQPGTSFGGYVMLVAEYPITEDWVFNGGALLGVASPSIYNSPLTSSAVRSVGYMGVKYVF
ncbi:MipA/OmpV family protein [Motilimonas eburnea]|uniref:MipA/OmpV family protein n=1 Tax=Motilimonas eburnea TaxID=1737488 RepID=UPI001E352D43|nr:MipA/OmpV family protein [Motilimonas eburnea]